MAKKCDIIYRDSHFYVGTCSRTKNGIYLLMLPLSVVSDTVDDERLGSICLFHLNLSSVGVPDPYGYTIVYKDFLKHVGFKSSKKFFSHAKRLTLMEKNNAIAIIPFKQMKIVDQYDEIKDGTKICTADAKIIGTMVKERITICTLFKN